MGEMRRVLGLGSGLENLADLARQVAQVMMQLGHPVAEAEDHFHTGQVDAQVALKTHDGPEPAHLGGFIAFHVAVMNDPDQP